MSCYFFVRSVFECVELGSQIQTPVSAVGILEPQKSTEPCTLLYSGNSGVGILRVTFWDEAVQRLHL